MDVDVQTQLYAQYSSPSFGRGTTEKVADLQDAVNKGLEIGSPRFKTFERAFVEIDGEVLEGKPKNPSADIYLGVDQIYSRDQVIDIRNKELDAERAKTLQDEFSQAIAVQSLRNVIGHLYHCSQSARFIAEKGSRGDFIELKDGESVYNSNGMRLFPPLSGGLAPEDAPEI